MILTAKAVAEYARTAGFEGVYLVMAVAIAHAESGFNTGSIGDINLTEIGERSVGLWQINYRPSRDQGNVFRNPTLNLDPLNNAKAAFQIWKSQGLGAWSTYTNGAFKKYVAEATLAVAQLQNGDPMATPNDTGKQIVNAFPMGGGYVIVTADGAVYAFNAAYFGRIEWDPSINAWKPVYPQ